MVNSSNRCEKQNDTLVGNRCKDNSRSWSDDGVLYMSQIRAIFENMNFKGERSDVSDDWFNTHQSKHTPVKLSETMESYMFTYHYIRNVPIFHHKITQNNTKHNKGHESKSP